MGSPFGVMKMFWNRIEVVVAQHCRVLNASEFSTLKSLKYNIHECRLDFKKKKKEKEQRACGPPAWNLSASDPGWFAGVEKYPSP